MRDFVREKICFYSSMFKGESNMHHIIECAHEFGVRGVEMMNFCDELKTPDKKAAAELGRLAKSYGLTLPVFSAASRLCGEHAKEDLQALLGYAEICADLEIPVLHHTIYPHLQREKIPTDPADLFNEGVEAALAVQEYAARLGVTTVVEDQGFLYNGLDAYRRFRAQTDEKIGFLLDVGNILFADEMPDTFLSELALCPAHVHLKDYAFCQSVTPPKNYVSFTGKCFVPAEIGTGDLPLTHTFEVLKQMRYDGLYSIEFECVKDMDEVARVLQRIAAVAR